MIENVRNEVATEGIINMVWEAFAAGNTKRLAVYQTLRFYFPFAS